MSKKTPETVPLKSVSELTIDPFNANAHTPRGTGMMEDSIRECGFGDSITVTSDLRVVSGNQRTETVMDLKMDNPIVVESDGSRPIVHVRTDLKAGDIRAVKLGLYSNRVGEVNLEWNREILRELQEADVDLAKLFTDQELAEVLMRVDGVDAPDLPSGDKEPFEQMTFTLHQDQAVIVRAAIKRAQCDGHSRSDINENSNGNALAAVCESYRG